MQQRSEQTVAFRIYHKGKDYIGTATIELPQIQQMTETIGGAGVAGEYDNPTIGITQSMTMKLSFNSIESNYFNAIDWTENELYECYSALQVTDDATGVRDSVPYQINAVGRMKNFGLGSMEQGKKHGNEIELEVIRLEILLDNEEEFLHDKLNFIYRVKGKDLLAKVRQQTGLNV